MSLLPPGPVVPAPLRWLGTAVDTVIVVLGGALVLVVFSNVVLHAFDQDIAWTTEFGELVMGVDYLPRGGSGGAPQRAHGSVRTH